MASTASRLPLEGGPLDGHAIPRRSGKYAWVKGRNIEVAGVVAPVLEGGAASSQPTNGAALYKLATDCLSYLYVGHLIAYCNACGAYHSRAERGRETRPCALAPASAPWHGKRGRAR